MKPTLLTLMVFVRSHQQKCERICFPQHNEKHNSIEGPYKVFIVDTTVRLLFFPIPIFSNNSSSFSERNTYVFRKRFLLCHLNIFSDFRFSSRFSQNAHLKIIGNNSESSFLNHLRFIQKSSEF